jgi:hypothetical protein
MKIRYLRVTAFNKLKNPFSAWARLGRMQQMVRTFNLRQGMCVLDLGGTPDIWSYSFIPALNITIVNLPGTVEKAIQSQHHFRYVEGDGCNVEGIGDQTFDFVFSNSVIEHVGGPLRRRAFANEIRRIGKSYWVQTPSIWFPIEAHNGMPFWWFYPACLRHWLIERWRKKLPAWTEMVETTTVIKRSELARLFPEATVVVERVLGIPKSYSAVSVAVSAPAESATGESSRTLGESDRSPP